MANLTATTYPELSGLLDRRNSSGPVPIGHNTTVERSPAGNLVIRLHSSAIVQLHPLGWVAVTTAGWDTVTTRERINQFLRPVSAGVHRVRGRLHAYGPEIGDSSPWDGDWIVP